MFKQDRLELHQAEAVSAKSRPSGRELTTDEMREIVGGPIIDNGESIAPAAVTGGK